MIEMSLKTLVECHCSSSQDLDGCPRCILAGANQYDLPDVSRNEAIKYLEAIIKHKADMKEIAGGLDTVAVEGFLDSDLEYRFLAVMRSLNQTEFKNKLLRFGVEVSDVKIPDDQKEPVEFSIKRKDAESVMVYRMRHQKTLNTGNKTTIADFYFERIDNQQAKAIAVYLDGFRYHAGPQTSDRLAADFLKREALVNGDGVDNHKVWAMTWKDIEKFEKEPSEHPAKYFDLECTDQNDFMGLNAVVQLFRLLAGDTPDKSFMTCLRASAQAQKVSPSRNSNSLLKALSEIESTSKIFEEMNLRISECAGTDLAAIATKSEKCGFVFVSKSNGSKPTSFIYFSSPQTGRETPTFYDSWERLLYTFNIMQLISDEMIVRVWAES